MSGAIIRRLGRLENTMHLSDMPSLADRIKAGRMRNEAITPAERVAEGNARLREMRRQHVEKPLRGLSLRVLHALERTASVD